MSIQRREEKSAPSCGREREEGTGSSLYVFLCPWACSMQIGLRQERCVFYLRFSLRSSDLPLFYFRGLSPSRSFSHRHSGLLFPILTQSNSQGRYYDYSLFYRWTPRHREVEVACPRPHLKSEKLGFKPSIFIQEDWPHVPIQFHSQDVHSLRI